MAGLEPGTPERMAALRQIAAERAREKTLQADRRFQAWLERDFASHQRAQRRTALARCESCGVHVPVEPGQAPADAGHRCQEWQVRESQQRQAARSRADDTTS